MIPVRVFQRFSTLNAVSNGRAEVILGRGSFTESYPLFGYDLSQYNELFEEKLDLFVKLLDQQPVTWSGSTRSALTNQTVYPPVETGRLRTWVGVGGSPESVVRAARHGLPLTLAIIGGSAKRFLPYVDLYKRALKEFGRAPQPIAVHSPGHVAATDEQAKEEVWPHYLAMMNRIGRERGWPPRGRDDFEREAGSGRRPLCRRARNRGGEDRAHGEGSRSLAFRVSIQQRHAATRRADEEHRAVRHQGRRQISAASASALSTG